jgi:hypothetical protein
MLAATGFPLTRMPVRLEQGKTGRGGGDLAIVCPLRVDQQPARRYTHSSLANSTDARISPVGLTVKCTVSFT